MGNLLLGRHRIDTGCTGWSTCAHERRKRSAGGSVIFLPNLVAVCSICNGWIEDHPAEIRELTGDRFVLRPGDPEWDEMSKRNDRWRTP